MDETKLRQLLEQLHKELAKSGGVDEKGQALLRRVDEDIHHLLERTEGKQQPSLVESLQETIAHFEATHPALTAALAQALNTLSNAGI